MQNSSKIQSISFTYVKAQPVSEYNDNIRIFCLAFPWLFPGGKGDYCNRRDNKITIDIWMNHMLLYKDGRFAKDPMWSFFALNYSSRRKNQQSGGYFVNGFFKDGPQTLEDLQQNISSGDTNWIDRISYFSKTVKGSPGYWRAKRKEVFSWINYHLEKGHGPPSFFITLSCAEYHWQDIKRLIKERLVKADIEHDDFENNFVKYVNEYSIVVQEYFQARVQIWLDTIGKHVFKIKHYWVRFEFAPSRGQIHAHMIVIADTQEMMKLISRAPSNEKKSRTFGHVG